MRRLVTFGNRRCVCLSTIVLLTFGTLATQVVNVCRADEEDRRPNVLFIAVDDLRPELGCYGVKSIISPNIDRLAGRGVTFNRAYCQQAVCNPSRASLMTGLRPDSTRVWDLITDFRDTIPEVVTIPQHFRRHGYHAVSYGKIFHNTFPDNESWDEPHRWPENARLWSEKAKQDLADFRRKMKADGKSEPAIKRMRAVGTEIVDIPDSEHIDGAIADQAIDAMRRLAKTERPFFLAAGFVRPHLPFVVPRKYWDLYDRSKIPLADNQFLPRGMPELAFGTGSMGGFYELRDYMDYLDTPSPLDGSLSEEQQRELKHGYYASVSLVDAQVGRLLDELDRQDLSENTIIVLWGDHGWKLGEHNGWCKQTNFEIDTRSPLILVAPGAKAMGQSCDALVEFVDIYPTLSELAGLPPVESLEGRSMVPLLDRPEQPWKVAAVSQFSRRHEGREYMGYTMRTERDRYVEWIDRDTGETFAVELYDHQSDPQENENIADLPGNEELVRGRRRLLWEQIPRPAPRKKPVETADAGILYKVTPPPAELGLDPFYAKFTSASRYPIVASKQVNDFALKEAGYLVDMMLANRPDVRKAMIDGGSRMCIIAHNEFTTDLPEWAEFSPKDYWDARARGTGGSQTDPYCSCGEENLLGYSGDPYSTECILTRTSRNHTGLNIA